MTARFLSFSIYLTLPTISALIILSTLKSKAQLMKECENDIVDYYYRIYHYFKTIKDYKRTLYKKRKEEDFNQQNLNFFYHYYVFPRRYYHHNYDISRITT